MTLTREELTEIRSWYDAQIACGVHPYDIGKLLDFATEMLPIHDALVAKYAAKATEQAEIVKAGLACTGSRAYYAMQEYDAARETFNKLARELVERDGAT